MDLAVPITGLYAALQALISLGLQLPIGRKRVATDISIYDGGDKELAVAIRRHGNWTEHVPYAVVLLALLELNGAGAGFLHTLGLILLVARIAHPLGLNAATAKNPLRGLGAFGTLAVSLAAALMLLRQYLA
jgi:uncharacterized membrane protein YecN with MAPEG domain